MDPTRAPESGTIVRGRSDNLVEVKHLFRNASFEVTREATSKRGPVRLRFSDMTELEFYYDEVGVWRCVLARAGLQPPTIQSLPKDGVLEEDTWPSEFAVFSTPMRGLELHDGVRWVRVA